MFKSIATTLALATGLGLAAVSGASAAPLVQPTALADAAPAQVENVHYRNGRRHIHRGRVVQPGYVYRRHYRSRPRVGFGVQLNLGPRYVAPRYQPAPVYRGYSARHHAWCEGRYRSYSRHSGTFQPYHGPRRRCNSPYDGI